MARLIHLKFSEYHLFSRLMNLFPRTFVVLERIEKKTGIMPNQPGGFVMPGPTEYTITCLYTDEIYEYIERYRTDYFEDDLLEPLSMIFEFYLGERVLLE